MTENIHGIFSQKTLNELQKPWKKEIIRKNNEKKGQREETSYNAVFFDEDRNPSNPFNTLPHCPGSCK